MIGVLGAASLSAIRSPIAIGLPAAQPLIRIASIFRNSAPRARSATVRDPSALLNSGEMLSNRATPAAPMATRYAAMSPMFGAMMPRSDSYTPVRTSRMNFAPVARATARLAMGSQRRLTPNGTLTRSTSRPTVAAIAVATSTPTFSWYG